MGNLLHFGGILVVDRKALITVGNWNPNVIAHEEDELYARFKKSGLRIVRLRRWFVCITPTKPAGWEASSQTTFR